jgi:hypothetical protein
VLGWAPQGSDLEQVLVLGLLHGLVPVQVPEPVLGPVLVLVPVLGPVLVLVPVLAPEQVLESDLDSYY